jgi:sterol-4alpha-carboxylate 3-dehydrogenase (decarboxylating)
MAIHHIVNIYRQGRTGFQVGSNDNLFDFTYVKNVAHAHLLAARALLHTHASPIQPLDHERVDGEAFLVTNDTPIYFWDFCRAVWNAAGSPLGTDHVWVLPRDVGYVLGYLSECFFAIIRKPPTFNRQRIVYSCMTRYYDISKAKRRLGYEPLVSLDDGVKRSVRWTLEQEKKEVKAG